MTERIMTYLERFQTKKHKTLRFVQK